MWVRGECWGGIQRRREWKNTNAKERNKAVREHKGTDIRRSGLEVEEYGDCEKGIMEVRGRWKYGERDVGEWLRGRGMKIKKKK